MSGLIPDRQSNAVTGSVFANANLNVDRPTRENNILNEALNGNIPPFMRKFVSVVIQENGNKITYLVIPDVFSIGNDDDFIRMPMNPLTAQKIANQYNCILPTKKMCDQIWKEATIKLSPQPKGPPYDNSMLATSTFIDHNNKIEKQLVGKPLGELITGHKKDVIIDKQLLTKTDRVAIYGWFMPDGKAIQGPTPNCSSHEITYQDYSHGIRFIAREVYVNDQILDIYDVLNDPALAGLISEEGAYDARTIYKS